MITLFICTLSKITDRSQNITIAYYNTGDLNRLQNYLEIILRVTCFHLKRDVVVSRHRSRLSLLRKSSEPSAISIAAFDCHADISHNPNPFDWFRLDMSKIWQILPPNSTHLPLVACILFHSHLVSNGDPAGALVCTMWRLPSDVEARTFLSLLHQQCDPLRSVGLHCGAQQAHLREHDMQLKAATAVCPSSM